MDQEKNQVMVKKFKKLKRTQTNNIPPYEHTYMCYILFYIGQRGLNYIKIEKQMRFHTDVLNCKQASICVAINCNIGEKEKQTNAKCKPWRIENETFVGENAGKPATYLEKTVAWILSSDPYVKR